MMLWVLGALLVQLVEPAAAEERTASYFASHPVELRGKLMACRDNPGRAKYDPECENVIQAQLNSAAAEARAHVDMTPPSDPKYWFSHSDELRSELMFCARNAKTLFCDSAMEAVRQGAGKPSK